jgi:hypothetical protein
MENISIQPEELNMSVCVHIHGRPADCREDYGESRMKTGMVFVNYPDVSARICLLAE